MSTVVCPLVPVRYLRTRRRQPRRCTVHTSISSFLGATNTTEALVQAIGQELMGP